MWGNARIIGWSFKQLIWNIPLFYTQTKNSWLLLTNFDIGGKGTIGKQSFEFAG